MGQLKVPMSLHAVSHCGTTTWHDEPMCCVKLWVTTAHPPNMTMVVPLCDTAHTTNPSLLWHGTERLTYVCDVSHCGTSTYCHEIHAVSHCRTNTYSYEHTCCLILWDNHLTLWAYVLCQAVGHYRFLWAYVPCHSMGQQTVSISMTMVVPLCDTAQTTSPPMLWNRTERQLYVCDVSHCGTPTYCHDTCCVTLWDNHQFLWAYMLCHNMGQPTVSISAVSHNGTTNYIKTIMGPRLRAPVRVPEALCNGRM